MLNPQEIMRRFPIGRILELSGQTKLQIKFLAHAMESIPLLQQRLRERMNLGPMSEDEMVAAVDKVFEEKPYEAMLSLAMGNGWQGPQSVLHANNANAVLRKLVWSLIYADIVQNYDIDRETYNRLKVSLLEKIPGGGVLVRGYDFEEKDLGHDDKPLRQDVCPDFPPQSFLEEEEDE